LFEGGPDEKEEKERGIKAVFFAKKAEEKESGTEGET